MTVNRSDGREIAVPRRSDRELAIEPIGSHPTSGRITRTGLPSRKATMFSTICG